MLLTSVVLLFAVLILADHERLEQASRLASVREVYYQGLRQQEQQVRTLRQTSGTLTVVRDGWSRGYGGALSYLEELSGSPALSGTRRICENETANAVLTAKSGAMRQAGLTPDFAVSLPEALPLSDTDLAALLGNALDNAMEAAVRTEDKTVTVRCRVQKGLFMLRVDNAWQVRWQRTCPPPRPTRPPTAWACRACGRSPGAAAGPWKRAPGTAGSSCWCASQWKTGLRSWAEGYLRRRLAPTGGTSPPLAFRPFLTELCGKTRRADKKFFSPCATFPRTGLYEKCRRNENGEVHTRKEVCYEKELDSNDPVPGPGRFHDSPPPMRPVRVSPIRTGALRDPLLRHS